MISKEHIDKCLDFAEGKKGKFTILMAKKPDFPETLIRGTEKQQIINGYVADGLTTREIANILNCKQSNIVEHMKQYKKSVSFYVEWCEFWSFITDVRGISVEDAFGDYLSCNDIERWKDNAGVNTVGDFLYCSVTMSSDALCRKLSVGNVGAIRKLDAATKNLLFECVRLLCYDVLKNS